MIIRGRTFCSPLLCLLMLIPGLAISALLSYQVGVPLFSSLSMIAYLFCAFYFWEKARIYFLAVFPFFVAYLGAIISNFYLEKGVYISEQYNFSSATGSTYRLVIYSSILLLSAGISLRLFLPSIHMNNLVEENIKRREDMVKFVIGMLLICLVILWVANFFFGMPIAQGINRFDYWKDHPLPQLRTILVQLSQLAFALGWLHGSTDSHKQRRVISAFLILIFVTNFSFGNKFSSNFLSLTNFAIASISARILVFSRHKIGLIKIIIVSLVIGAIFYFLISWFYSNIEKIDAELVNEYILDRALALQGHTWWGVDYLVKNGFQRGNFFDLFHSHSEKDPGGLYMLMYAISPTAAVNSYLDNGITYTMGGTAIAIYSLGYWWACLYLFVAGSIVGVSLMYLLRKATQFQFFRMLVALKIVWLEVLAFNMGNPYLMLGLSAAVYLTIVIFDLLILREKSVAFKLNILKIKFFHFNFRHFQ